MKLVFFNRFFHPNNSATSQLLSDLAFHLAQRGNEVHVVTSRGKDDAANEVVQGVHVHRVAEVPGAPDTLPRRAGAYARFYVAARKAARALVEADDVVVAKTDPPLLASAIFPIANARKARRVLWLQDLFPEVAVEYGVPGMRGPVRRFFCRLRNRSLREADLVVAVSERMASKIVSLADLPPAKVRVVHNWADGSQISPLPHSQNGLRREWQLGERFVVAYSGNLGRVHEFDTILDAAARLRDQAGIVFLFVGDGPRLGDVKSRVQELGLANVRFERRQARERVREVLGLADVHLAVLGPRFEGLALPSKLYGVLAAGRPTVFIGDPEGEVATLLKRADAGRGVRTGDAAALASTLLELRGDAAARQAQGDNARGIFEREFDQPIALAKWESLLAGQSAS